MVGGSGDTSNFTRHRNLSFWQLTLPKAIFCKRISSAWIRIKLGYVTYLTMYFLIFIYITNNSQYLGRYCCLFNRLLAKMAEIWQIRYEFRSYVFVWKSSNDRDDSCLARRDAQWIVQKRGLRQKYPKLWQLLGFSHQHACQRAQTRKWKNMLVQISLFRTL